MEDDIHPLATWLKGKGISALQFGKEHNIPFGTLYSHMRGDRDPATRVMLAIENATGGEVTLRQQVDWTLSRQV